MSKTTKTRGYRVVIEPRSIGNYGFVRLSDHTVEPDEQRRLKEYREICEEIADQVRRHVDNVSFVEVEAETEPICEYCGKYWTEDSSEYNGGCCDKDQEHDPEVTHE